MMMLGFMNHVSLLNVSPNLPPKKQHPLRSSKSSCIVQRHLSHSYSKAQKFVN